MRYLTSTNPELEKLARSTPRGMAHWAGTGPVGASCDKCVHHADINVAGGKRVKHNRCLKFYRMMGRPGGVASPDTPACRHFEVERLQCPARVRR
jgi:hypothetical protein